MNDAFSWATRPSESLAVGGDLVGGGALQLAGGLPALLVGGYLTGDGGAVRGLHGHVRERALAHGDGRGVVDGGVVGAVLGRDLDRRLGGLLGGGLVDLGLRTAGVAAVAAWPCRRSPLHAESTSTPPSSADATIRPLRRLLSVITRFSIVAESPKPREPRNDLSTLRPVRPVPHPVPGVGHTTSSISPRRIVAIDRCVTTVRLSVTAPLETTKPRTAVAARGHDSPKPLQPTTSSSSSSAVIILVEVPIRRIGVVVDRLTAPGGLREFDPGHLADQVERVDEIGEGLGSVFRHCALGVRPLVGRHAR